MLDVNTAILIGVIIFLLCGTYILAKYIKTVNETKVELERIAKGIKKESPKRNSYPEIPIRYYYTETPIEHKDADPTTMFTAVSDNTQRHYVAEDASKTVKMPKVEVEEDE